MIILNSYHLKNDGSHRLRFYGGICKSAMSRSFLTIFHKNFCANPKNGLFSSSQGWFKETKRTIPFLYKTVLIRHPYFIGF